MRKPLDATPRIWQRVRGAITISSLGLEIGIVGSCVAAMVTVGRLFTDQSAMTIIVVAALLSHGVAIASRWAKLPWIASAATSALVVALSVCAALMPATVRFGAIPTSATWAEVERSLIQAWNTFVSVRAPTEPLLGFTLVGVAGAWLISTLTDAIAYRLGFLIEALVPSSIVVVLTSALAADTNRVRALLPYVAAVCAVVGAARVRELARDAWLGPKPRRAGAIGASLFVVTALGAVGLAGARPPSWVSAGLIDLQANDRAPSRPIRTASNPLVSTRAHLVALADEELFIGRSSTRSYWRLTSLDTYSDDQWTATRGTYREEKAKDASPDDRVVDITLQGLADTWLPVQQPIRSVTGLHPDGVEATVAFDRRSDSVLLDDRAGRGDTYTLTLSTDPAAGFEPINGEQLQQLLKLPGTLTPAVAQLAREATAEAVTDTERMEQLEAFFRTQFVYDLDIARTASLGIDQFLFDVRRGYCEQFASSFAVMARTLGVPSRVAIGFVPGRLTAAGYQVRGQDAHAWPEVYVDGRWVAYEPTPSRGVADGNPPAPTSVPPITEPVQSPSSAASVPTTAPATTDLPATLDPAPQSAVSVATLLWWAVLVLGLVGLWFMPWAIRRTRSRRGYASDGDTVPIAIASAWRGLEDDLAWAGAARASSEPIGTWLTRVRRTRCADWSTVADIATRVESLRYGPPATSAQGSDLSRLLQADIAAVRTEVVGGLPRRRRLSRWLSFGLRPRPSRLVGPKTLRPNS